MNVGVVDVYEVDLGAHGWSDDVIDALVPPHERTAPHASRVVRALTRHLLGLRLVTDPAAVPITRVCERCGHPTHGRPRLAEGPVFGATHSGDRALVAVADGPSALGVDLEVIRPRADLDRLAARVLDRVELAT